MFSKTTLKTVAATLIALAIVYRVDPAKDLLTGDKKFLGMF